MNDWRALLRIPAFRRYWLALLSDNLGSWAVIAALPVLVANRFGAGLVLVASLGLRVVPKVVLAPLASRLQGRFGAPRIAAAALCVQAVLSALLPFATSLTALETLIAAIGALDVFVMPALLALRNVVLPEGLAMAGNTLCSVAERIARIVGPALGGVLLLAGTDWAFTLFGLMIALAAWPVGRLSAPATDGRGRGSVLAFLDIFRRDKQVLGLFIAAITYTVMMGGVRPFLSWANREWFGGADTAWTHLLAAQGAGALLGAVVSALLAGRLIRAMPAYVLTLVAGFAEGVLMLLLLAATNAVQAMALLALAGVPEIISTAAWFTAAQQRLSPGRQAVLFTFAAPLWDLAYALGTASAALHADGVLSLGGYWALVASIATVPLLPLLAIRSRTVEG